MANKTCATLVAAAMMTVTAGSAFAAKCNLVGTFTDTIGSTATFTTQKVGTVSNPLICADPYLLKVTLETKTLVDISGKTKDKTCGPTLTGTFTFATGSCTTATGSVTIAGVGTFPDTITKVVTASRSARPTSSALTKGLK